MVDRLSFPFLCFFWGLRHFVFLGEIRSLLLDFDLLEDIGSSSNFRFPDVTSAALKPRNGPKDRANSGGGRLWGYLTDASQQWRDRFAQIWPS